MENIAQNLMANSEVIIAYKAKLSNPSIKNRELALHFGVTTRTIINWLNRVRDTGLFIANPINLSQEEIDNNVNKVIVALAENEEKPDSIKVYLMSDSNYQKIGIATDLLGRLSGIQCGNPLKVNVVAVYEPDIRAAKLEKKLHKHFDKQRMQGEWFNINLTEGEFIALCKEYDKE